MTHCAKCGAELIGSRRFCSACGAPVTDPRAGLAAELHLGDAATGATPANGTVDLVITNPPMGRRIERGRHADLLERFVARAAAVLKPGGRLVWLVPEPRAVHTRAAQAGLVLLRAFTVDMGGFPAALSVHEKRSARRS